MSLSFNLGWVFKCEKDTNSSITERTQAESPNRGSLWNVPAIMDLKGSLLKC